MKLFYPFLFLVVIAFAACGEAHDANSINGQRGNATSVKNLIDNPVTAEQPKDTVNVAKIVFAEEKFNFGKAKEGEMIKHTFRFKNTGVVPLLIRSARSTCGCTVPEFPRDPIPVNGTGEINVTFNTSGKSGHNKKPIIIVANTNPVEKTYVEIEGDVEGKGGSKDASKEPSAH